MSSDDFEDGSSERTIVGERLSVVTESKVSRSEEAYVIVIAGPNVGEMFKVGTGGDIGRGSDVEFRLTDTEIRATIFHLIVAGHETTTNLLGNILYELIRQPDLLAAVRRDRSLIPAVVEESLRHDSPAQMMVRDCTRPTDIASVKLDAGEKVILSIASANRDEAVYDDPRAFRLDRGEDLDHVAFGFGRHLCLGAPLARLEAAVALRVFLDQLDHVEFAPGFRYEKNPAFWVLGPLGLDVVLR